MFIECVDACDVGSTIAEDEVDGLLGEVGEDGVDGGGGGDVALEDVDAGDRGHLLEVDGDDTRLAVGSGGGGGVGGRRWWH